jgi:hypothetical protein
VWSFHPYSHPAIKLKLRGLFAKAVRFIYERDKHIIGGINI